MKSTSVSLLLAILLVQTFLLSAYAQNATAAEIPPKCCNPMHMPVNGKCQRVQCRNDDGCANQFQAYCTKYNKGQPLCRGLSRVCGCNGEQSDIDKKPSGLNCPANEICYPNGQCGPKEGRQCKNTDHVPKDGQCQKVQCTRDVQCEGYRPYCKKYNIGTPLCRVRSEVCGCNGQSSSANRHAATIKSCNRELNGNDKCKKGEVCFPNGECGPPPNCAFHGATCDPQKKNACCKGYCHKRRLISSYKCVRTAFARESCASGIPCEAGSNCIKKMCSLRNGDDCNFEGAVCPLDNYCKHVPMNTNKQKMCVNRKYS